MRVKAIPKARMKDNCPRVPSTAELSSFSRALVPCQVVLLPSDLLTSCLSCYITHKLSVLCLLFYHFLQSGMLYFTVPHSSSLPLLYYLFVHPALSHGCGIWAPGTSSEVPAPLARAALSYAGCLVTALITQVAKFSLKKKIPVLPNSLSWSKAASGAGIFQALGLSLISCCPCGKLQQNRGSLLKACRGDAANHRHPHCLHAASLLHSHEHKLSPEPTAGWLMAGGRSRLAMWQRRACLSLPLPGVSTLQDSVLKLKDVSNYWPGSWEAV